MLAHDHGSSNYHAVISLEVLDLANGQDVHLHSPLRDLLTHCQGDVDDRTGHFGAGNKDSIHYRIS